MEKVIRERFAKAVARGIQDLRVSRATSSPINGLIENAVIEVYFHSFPASHVKCYLLYLLKL